MKMMILDLEITRMIRLRREKITVEKGRIYISMRTMVILMTVKVKDKRFSSQP
jgi:hypothetical protein